MKKTQKPKQATSTSRPNLILFAGFVYRVSDGELEAYNALIKRVQEAKNSARLNEDLVKRAYAKFLLSLTTDARMVGFIHASPKF